jgi:hypothetical protein
MRKWLIFAGIGTTSGALGVVAGYFLRGFVDKKRSQNAKNEAEKAELAKIEENAVIDPSLDDKKELTNEVKKDENKLPEVINYNEIIAKYDDVELANKEDIAENPFTDEPYLITSEQYCDEVGYEKKIINYYAGDGIFANSDDSIVQDTAIFGADSALTKEFYRLKDDEFNESWYVRNDKLGCDYEIVRFPGAYKIIVLGEKYE